MVYWIFGIISSINSVKNSVILFRRRPFGQSSKNGGHWGERKKKKCRRRCPAFMQTKQCLCTNKQFMNAKETFMVTFFFPLHIYRNETVLLARYLCRCSPDSVVLVTPEQLFNQNLINGLWLEVIRYIKEIHDIIKNKIK